MTVKLPIRVMAFETDYGGVVSNTRYPEYLERGRYALCEAADINIQELWDTQGVQPVVRALSIEYQNFARHEDRLTLTVTVTEHSKTSSQLSFELRRDSDDALIISARQTLAYINERFRPTRVPDAFRVGMAVEG